MLGFVHNQKSGGAKMESMAKPSGRGRGVSERRFYTFMSIAMLAVAYIGFARSFYLRPLFPEWPAPPEPIFYVHGLFFSAWCVLLVTQAMLIGAGRADVHRKLGIAGVVVAIGMVVLGIARRAHRGQPADGVRRRRHCPRSSSWWCRSSTSCSSRCFLAWQWRTAATRRRTSA